MKTLLLVLYVFVATAAAVPSQPQAAIAIPEKCEDVLAVKVCNRLKSIALSIKLKTGIVKDAVADAVKKGKNSTEDIYNSVKTFYLEKIKDKQCQDFLKVEYCQKLLDIGSRISVNSKEVHEYVKQALISGKEKANEVYDNVKKYFKLKFSGKSCEQVLEDTLLRNAKDTICRTLQKSASAVKVSSEKVKALVTDAAINGYKNATAFIKATLRKIKEYSEEITTCENLLNPDLCSNLREYARKTKVAIPKIMSTVRDILMTGARVTKGFLSIVYKITDAFIDCEDFFTAKSCTLLKEKIAKVGGTLSDVGKAVRDIAVKVGDKVSDAYKTVVEYTKSKLCKYLKLSCPSSISAENSVTKRSAIINDFLKKYKDMLSSGIADAKKKLQESLNDIMDSMKNVDKAVQNIMERIINDSKGKYEEIKDLLKKLMNAITGSNGNNTDMIIVKRGLKEDLKQALSVAYGHLKQAIEHLLTFTKTQLQTMKDYINALLKKVFEVARGKREIDDSQEVEEFAEAIAEEETKKLELEVEDIVENIIDHAITEIQCFKSSDNEIEEQETKRKRDLTSAVSKAKEFFGTVGDKLKEALSKIRGTNIEDIREALKKGGMKLIGIAEDILKKIQAELRQ